MPTQWDRATAVQYSKPFRYLLPACDKSLRCDLRVKELHTAVLGGIVQKSMENDYLPTPAFTSMTGADRELVYEPAEDTMLFMDALAKEKQFLRTRKPSVMLEVGSGSGVVSVFAASMLPTCSYHLCTDINISACRVTRKVGLENGIILEAVATDLVAAFGDHLKGMIDVLLFNPPYVVTPSTEVGSKGITASWAGGHRGRDVIDRMLPQVGEILSDTGVFYLVALKENDIDEIKLLMERRSYAMDVVLKRRTGPEELYILRFCRK